MHPPLPAPPVSLESAASLGDLSLLAVVQGLTEFLPISSSGHLVLVQSLLGMEEAPLAIDVALHVGTLLAVVVVYRGALADLARDVLAGRLRELGLLFLGSLPVGIVGFTLKDAIERGFHSARLAGVGLLVTALALGLGEAGRRRRLATGREPRELGPREALLIGAVQALALVPGISRSGTTIAAGLLLGLAPERAARFSFLLSIPAIAAAAGLALPQLHAGNGTAGAADGPGGNGGWLLLWAVLLSGLVGWAALRGLLAFLDRGAFRWFMLYCLALGVLALISA